MPLPRGGRDEWRDRVLVKRACCITVTATDQLTGRDLSRTARYEALGTTSPASTSRACRALSWVRCGCNDAPAAMRKERICSHRCATMAGLRDAYRRRKSAMMPLAEPDRNTSGSIDCMMPQSKWDLMGEKPVALSGT